MLTAFVMLIPGGFSIGSKQVDYKEDNKLYRADKDGQSETRTILRFPIQSCLHDGESQRAANIFYSINDRVVLMMFTGKP